MQIMGKIIFSGVRVHGRKGMKSSFSWVSGQDSCPPSWIHPWMLQGRWAGSGGRGSDGTGLSDNEVIPPIWWLTGCG